jgi:hypothetical protein
MAGPLFETPPARRTGLAHALAPMGPARDSPQNPDSPASFLESVRGHQVKEVANRAGLFFCADQKGQIDLAMVSTVLMTSLMTRTRP